MSAVREVFQEYRSLLAHSIFERDEERDAFNVLGTFRTFFCLQFLICPQADEYAPLILEFLEHRVFQNQENKDKLKSTLQELRNYFPNRLQYFRKKQDIPEKVYDLARKMADPCLAVMLLLQENKDWSFPPSMQRTLRAFERQFNFIYGKYIRFFVRQALKETPWNKQEQVSHSLIDGVQEGFIGGWEAVHRFDPSKGWRFTTYASWWIRHQVGRAVHEKADVVRLPVHVHEGLRRIFKTMKKHHLLNTPPEELQEFLSRETGFSPKKVGALLEVSKYGSTYSLDAPIGEDDETTIKDTLSEEPQVETLLDQERTAEQVQTVLEQLPLAHREILRRRANDETLKEIGDSMGVSRERIRQIQEFALSRLRGNEQLLSLV